MFVTDDVEAVTHKAMESANGKISVASKLLNISSSDLKNRIANNKNLSARWQNKKQSPQPPGEAVTIHREAITTEEPPLLQSEEDVALALKKEDAAIRNGMDGMGLSKSGLDLAVVCQQFHRKHFRSALEGMSGGIYRQFMKVMEAIDEIEERLKNQGKESDFPLTLPEELMLREDRAKLLIVMGQFKDKVDKSVLITAQAEKIRKEREGKRDNWKPKGVLDLESAAT